MQESLFGIIALELLVRHLDLVNNQCRGTMHQMFGNLEEEVTIAVSPLDIKWLWITWPTNHEITFISICIQKWQTYWMCSRAVGQICNNISFIISLCSSRICIMKLKNAVHKLFCLKIHLKNTLRHLFFSPRGRQVKTTNFPV